MRDPEFLDVLGSSPEVLELVKTNAHEGGVWHPDKNEFYFTSTQLTGSSGNARADAGIRSYCCFRSYLLMSSVFFEIRV